MAMSFLQQAVNGNTLTTYTFSTQSLGTAAADRYIAVAGGWRKSGSAPTLSTVTVGGESATSIVNYKSGTTTACGAFIFLAAVPTGTTGDVVVTFTADAASCGIALYRITGLASTTATATGTSDAEPRTADVNVLAGGVVIAVDYNNVALASTTTFTGVTENYDVDAITNAHHFAGGSTTSSSAVTPLTVTSDWTQDEGTTTSRAFAVATFEMLSGPASLKTRDTIAKASVKTIDGVAIASVKTIDTVT